MNAFFRSALVRSGMALSLLGVLTACADKHDFQKLTSPDGGFVLTVDFITHPITRQLDAVVSVQERQGLATEIAAFGKVQKLNASWIGPQDIGICQVGNVKIYKRQVDLNAHDGVHSFHIQYSCP